MSPELRRGIRVSFGFAIVAVGRQAHRADPRPAGARSGASSAPTGSDPCFVYSAAALATGVIVLVLWLSRIAYIRLVHAAEDTLYGLRVRVFEHIHRLSLADHNETKKGIFVSRVTSDIETLARFAQWGAVAWVVDGTLIVGTLIVMFVYSWQLAIVVILAYLPVLPIFRFLQRGQLRAYDLARTRTGDMLSEVSEVVGRRGGRARVRPRGPRPAPAARPHPQPLPGPHARRLVLRGHVPARRRLRLDRDRGGHRRRRLRGPAASGSTSARSSRSCSSRT